MQHLLLRNPWLIGILILVGAPLLTVVQLSQMGEIHHWIDIWHALDHASVPAFCSFVSWLLFQSPLSGSFQQAIYSQKSVAPDGSVTTKDATIMVSKSTPGPGAAKE